MINQHPSPFVLLLFAALLFALCAFPFAIARAQSATSTLSGTVEDQNGAVVPGATVTVKSPYTGLNRETTTNDAGYFTVPLLPPGAYTVRAQHEGFKIVQIDIVLNVGDQRVLQIPLQTGDVKEVVNVTGEAPLINESPAVATTVDRQFVENLPLNGRSFQSLISLTPGVALTTVTGGGEQGQFTVNGQRPDTNYFTVDGVSANIGLSPNTSLGQQAGGTLPGGAVTGGTNSLVSVDALQEFKIQTSTYAPEFGRQPGAQVQILTRSGVNDFRGAVFEYFRNDALDANDWFANANRLPRPALRQSDFGGVLGGPIIKDRTFFFFSYEGLRLRLPQTAIVDVPSSAARQDPRASVAVRQLLNAFPRPNGPDRNGGFAQFAASYSNPSNLDATSIRLDHTVNDNLTVFGRYNYAPSKTVERGGVGTTLSQLFPTQLDTETLTVGVTWAVTPKVNNEFRANYSNVQGSISFLLDDFGGAVPPGPLFSSSGASSQESAFAAFLVSGVQALLFTGKGNNNRQRQINLVNNTTVVTGSHQLKFGVDYRRVSPVFDPLSFQEFLFFNDVNQAITGTTLFISVNSFDSNVLYFNNFSAFGQDTWKATRRLTLTYGLRWDVNPPPKGERELFSFRGLDNPVTLSLAPEGTPLWETTYNNFAPRIGVAYQLSQSQGKEMVLRGGFGIFYDLGTGSSGYQAEIFPYRRSRTLFGEPYPSVRAEPIPFTLSPPYGTIRIFDPNLKLPRTYQWNVTVEKSLGHDQTVSAAYVGAAGRRLLRVERLTRPNVNITSAIVGRNSATSDYHAMQLQYNRRLSRGLQALASYTWSHSIDNASSDSVENTPGELVDPKIDRGPSDFDVRHAFNAAVTYNIPFPDMSGVGNAVFHNWSVDAIYRGRTATPVNVTTGAAIFGVSQVFRPDLIQGVPLYIDDPLAPGGRRINRAAFAVPPAGRQGTLGRNALRGFSFSRVDFALRRQFNLTERVNLQLRAEFFNLFNHPNFANPGAGDFNGSNALTNPLFGQSTRMLGRGLGSGGVSGGFNPLYQTGGPRSIQLALKLLFY